MQWNVGCMDAWMYVDRAVMQMELPEFSLFL
jgi:hypothetical protein